MVTFIVELAYRYQYCLLDENKLDIPQSLNSYPRLFLGYIPYDSDIPTHIIYQPNLLMVVLEFLHYTHGRINMKQCIEFCIQQIRAPSLKYFSIFIFCLLLSIEGLYTDFLSARSLYSSNMKYPSYASSNHYSLTLIFPIPPLLLLVFPSLVFCI